MAHILAQAPAPLGDPAVPNPIATEPGFVFDTLVAQVFNILFIGAGILAVLFIIISGIMFILSFGRDEARARAAKTFFSAIIGLVIVFTAYLVVNVALSALGIDPFYRI
ncbi:MAG: hypothetical protein WD603_01225 [Patescibacteria group bacterium]